MKITKKHIGKKIEFKWIDPRSEVRIDFTAFKKQGVFRCHNVGWVKDVCKDKETGKWLVYITTEFNEEDQVSDLTLMVYSLMYDIKFL